MSALDLNNKYAHFNDLEMHDKIIAEYIWIDGSGILLRSKCRTLERPENDADIKLDDIPEWNFDGSSCYMATTENSEVILKPVFWCRDPFRRHGCIMVFCETFRWEDTSCQKLVPANTNFRHFANKVWDHPKVAGEETWYGIEQEYTMLESFSKFTSHPLGWPSNGYPGPQGPYYCSVGASACYGRIIADFHYRACIYAGLTISGTNAEVMPGQWEFQIGPAKGVEIGDHLWMARYLLGRVAEDFNVVISYAPKLFPEWNGSGCHCNYSTKTMREGEKGM